MKNIKIAVVLFLGVLLISLSFGGYSVNASPLFNSQTISSSGDISTMYKVVEGAVLPTSDDQLGGVVTSVSDSLLSTRMLQIYKHYNPSYSSNYIRLNMFEDFEMLNLSNIIQGTDNVLSLDGLKNLNFKNLKNLDLSNNNIEVFGASILPKINALDYDTSKSMVLSIETLNLSNNRLAGVLDVAGGIEKVDEVNTAKIYFDKLTNLNVSNNQLTGLSFNTDQLKETYIDLRNNKISNFSDLKLPTTANVKLILFANPINNISNIPSNISIEVGLLNLTNNLTSADLIKYIEFEELEIAIKIYEKQPLENNPQEYTFVEYNYNPTNLTNFSFKLPAGNYKVDYIRDDSVIVSSKEFTVTPPIASYHFLIKNKVYQTYSQKITGKGKIVFSLPEGYNDVEIYYNYGDAKWYKGKEADLTKKNGFYALKFKTIENGIESTEYGILVRVSYNKFLPDIAIIIVIILFIIFLAMVMVPLLKKLMEKMSKNN